MTSLCTNANIDANVAIIKKTATNFADANCIYGDFFYKEDGETIGKITLSANCSFSIKNYEDGGSMQGSYSIDGEIYNGASIYFTDNNTNKTYSGYIWMDSGKIKISFEGLTFTSGRR
jgi:hypothetical protein